MRVPALALGAPILLPVLGLWDQTAFEAELAVPSSFTLLRLSGPLYRAPVSVRTIP
jgi:hypothetical protein